jgi:Fe2+ or Zn2+ uptake regulation protein
MGVVWTKRMQFDIAILAEYLSLSTAYRKLGGLKKSGIVQDAQISAPF